MEHPATQLLLKEALQAHREGQLQKALDLYQQILAQQPQHFDALHMAGVLAIQSGQFEQGQKLIEAAIVQNNTYSDAYSNLASALYEQKKYQEALPHSQKALQLDMRNLSALIVQGNIYMALKQFELALASFDTAISIDRQCVSALVNRGKCLFALAKQPHEKENQHKMQTSSSSQYDLRTALNQEPARTSVKQALQTLTQAEILAPNDPQIPFAQGAFFSEQGDYAQALVAYHRALGRDAAHIPSLVNQAIAFNKLGLLDEARASLKQAAVLHPDNADIFFDLGTLLAEHLLDDEALLAYDQALAIDPTHRKTPWNRALALLRTGDYARGWPAYESRLRAFIDNYHIATVNRWENSHTQNIENKRIAILQEQGLGDMLQFCRYIPLLKQKFKPSHIDIICDEGLVRLLKFTLEGCDEVKSLNSAKPLPTPSGVQHSNALAAQILENSKVGYDFFDFILSLPAKFETTLDSVPQQIPYFTLPTHRNTYTLDKPTPAPLPSPLLKVGIFWAGGQRPEQPETWDVEAQRSVDWSLISPLLQDAQISRFVQWTLLQRDRRPDALTTLAQQCHWLDPFGADSDLNQYAKNQNRKIDMLDTAYLINDLDLVIGVDSALIHLSAALGKRTWMLDRTNHCWRWQKKETGSVWYPNALTIYRQIHNDDWTHPLQRVRQHLIDLINTSSKTRQSI